MFQFKLPSSRYTHKYKNKNTWTQALTQFSFFTGDVISYLTVILHSILQYTFAYIQGVSGGIVNILGGGSMDCSE
jgi:hypothetical protein